MRAAQFIIQKLFQEGKVTLRQIGHFYLDPSSDRVPPAADSGEFTGRISFLQDPRAGQDEVLVSYIMQQTRKIKPLAEGDLESYLELEIGRAHV